jgi:hypothetical protein
MADEEDHKDEAAPHASKESSPEDVESAVTSLPGDGSWTMVSESSLPDENAGDPEDSTSKDFEWYANTLFYNGIILPSFLNFRISELRQALDEQCGLFEVCRIASGRVLPEDLRFRAWQVRSYF